MSIQNNNRNKWLHIRLTETEYNKINTGFSRAVNRTKSDYLRRIILEKPITVYTRNKSLDNLLDELIMLRRELSSIGNNFNQTVKKLHLLSRIPEIKTWAVLNEESKNIFFKKIEEIENKISQIDLKWSQE